MCVQMSIKLLVDHTCPPRGNFATKPFFPREYFALGISLIQKNLTRSRAFRSIDRPPTQTARSRRDLQRAAGVKTEEHWKIRRIKIPNDSCHVPFLVSSLWVRPLFNLDFFSICISFTNGQDISDLLLLPPRDPDRATVSLRIYSSSHFR